MRVLVILSIFCAVTLASGRRLVAIKRRRESKWDIIHHEYHGPPAPLSKDGRVIDTPEVAEAKANHLAIHAETAAELARKMAEANAEEARLKAAQSGPEAAPIVVAEPVQMTPELMAMLMAAAVEEQQQEVEEKKEEVAPAPVVEEVAEAPKEEVVSAPVSEATAEQPAAQEEPAAEEQPAAQEEPAAQEGPTAEEPAAAAAPAAEAPKQEEAKVTEEADANNEVEGSQGSNHPEYVVMRSYQGPLAPLDHIGRVIETPEVKKAREAHFAAYRQAIELAKAKEEQWKQENAAEEKQETKKKVFIRTPPIVHLMYQKSPIGYKGPEAPLGKDGRVIDTKEVERAKQEHKRALAHAQAIAKRHPPKPADNLI